MTGFQLSEILTSYSRVVIVRMYSFTKQMMSDTLHVHSWLIWSPGTGIFLFTEWAFCSVFAKSLQALLLLANPKFKVPSI